MIEIADLETVYVTRPLLQRDGFGFGVLKRVTVGHLDDTGLVSVIAE